MSDRIENMFMNFADSQEDLLKQMNMTKEEFVKNAKEWSKSEDGKLEIQKFILEQEINDLKSQIQVLEAKIEAKRISIKDIEEELEKL